MGHSKMTSLLSREEEIKGFVATALVLKSMPYAKWEEGGHNIS